MSIQNNEMMATATRCNFLLPQTVETTFTAEELAEDMDGIQLNFQQVKVPAGGALQYEIPTEDPDNPDYSHYLDGEAAILPELGKLLSDLGPDGRRQFLFRLLYYRYYNYELDQPFLPQYRENQRQLFAALRKEV